MFDPKSRYYSVETVTRITPDNRALAYVRRRFLPSTDTMPTLVEVMVNQGDRLDLITARTLGDPEQFWHICDANNAMNPIELMAEPGRRLRIALPQMF
jgi:hypothetical protein